MTLGKSYSLPRLLIPPLQLGKLLPTYKASGRKHVVPRGSTCTDSTRELVGISLR